MVRMTRQRARRFKPTAIFGLLTETFSRWRAAHPSVLAAGLSYFALISLAPTIILFSTLVSHFWTHPNVQRLIFAKMMVFTGPETARTIGGLLAMDTKHSKGSATVFSLLVLYYAAARIFNQLHAAMNIVWDISPRDENFVRTFFRSTLRNLAMMVCVILFLSLFVATDAVLAFRRIDGMNAVHTGISLALFTLLLSAMYKMIPDVPVRWNDVWLGAIVTSCLIMTGKTIMAIYFSLQTFRSVYGAASSLIILMVWIYCAAQIFFFGAQMTSVYARRYGSRLRA